MSSEGGKTFRHIGKDRQTEGICGYVEMKLIVSCNRKNIVPQGSM